MRTEIWRSIAGYESLYVADIRAEYKPGVRERGIKTLAKRYGVSSTTMRNILSGRKWGHV